MFLKCKGDVTLVNLQCQLAMSIRNACFSHEFADMLHFWIAFKNFQGVAALQISSAMGCSTRITFGVARNEKWITQSQTAESHSRSITKMLLPSYWYCQSEHAYEIFRSVPESYGPVIDQSQHSYHLCHIINVFIYQREALYGEVLYTVIHQMGAQDKNQRLSDGELFVYAQEVMTDLVL